MFKNLNAEDVSVWALCIVIFSIIVTLVVFFNLAIFAAHDVRPYLQVTSSDDIMVYRVMLERKWGEDRRIYATTDFKAAQEFYFKLLKQYK